MMVCQVETDPIPHAIIDVRSAEDAESDPLPEDLKGAVHIPGASAPFSGACKAGHCHDGLHAVSILLISLCRAPS